MRISAVLFDFGDTLVQTPPQFDYETSLRSLHQSLVKNGIDIPYNEYKKAHLAIRDRVYAKVSLREVVFGVRVSEALSHFGYSLQVADPVIIEATEAFMEPWIQARTMGKCVPSILRNLKSEHKLGVVSNFSYTRAVWKTLDRFRLHGFFDAVVVSADVGWRKPSPKIFKAALHALKTSSSEAVFVGDELDQDVKGASNVGMRTILLKKTSATQSRCRVEPDETIDQLEALPRALERLKTRYH